MTTTLSICSYNLHGYHDKSPDRYFKIAQALSYYHPDVCLFQEAIKFDANSDDTATIIANELSHFVGYKYHIYQTYCHMYMDKFPEAVAVVSKHQLYTLTVVDLNNDLKYGVKSAMPRYAPILSCEICGKKVIFSSIHLDYNSNPIVRLAQAEKLLKVMLSQYNFADVMILGGDFNDVTHSPVIRFIRSMGFRDALYVVGDIEGVTYSADNPHCRIDYIFVKGYANVVDAKVILNSPAYSDHFGIWCLVEII